MSDPFDLDEVDDAPVRLDWRDRLADALDAAQLRPLHVGAALGCGVVVVVLVGLWLAERAAPATPVEAVLPFAQPTTTSLLVGPAPTVTVHVAGAVRLPGVYELDADGRVIDAVEAAGGPAPLADLGRLNLAAGLRDGEQVYVPGIGEVVPLPSLGSAESGEPSEAAPIDLNVAGAVDFERLPGIGPSLAAAIMRERERRGGFTSVDDLLDVPGIGETRLANIRDLVTV